MVALTDHSAVCSVFTPLSFRDSVRLIRQEFLFFVVDTALRCQDCKNHNDFPFCFFRIRLISLASQKFISDIANDALQYCKMKGTASGSSRSKTKVSFSQILNICFKCI